jgi:hypothetical protein
VRGVTHDLDPTGFARRFPGKQPKKVRGTPTDIGVYFEFHSDGHEKTNYKALLLGPASKVDVYGSRCHGSRFDLQSQAVPNA